MTKSLFDGSQAENTHKKTFDQTLVYYPDEKQNHVPPKMMFTQVKTYLQKCSKDFL